MLAIRCNSLSKRSNPQLRENSWRLTRPLKAEI
jgi:hypothetical protein